MDMQWNKNKSKSASGSDPASFTIISYELIYYLRPRPSLPRPSGMSQGAPACCPVSTALSPQVW